MATRISQAELLDKVMQGGIPDPAIAEQALRATLLVLGERLTDDEASAVAATLPEKWARVVDQSEYDRDFDDDEFYDRVGRREKTSLGVAREHADVVLRAASEALDEGLRTRLLRALPEAIGRRLRAPEIGEPPPHPASPHAPRLATLARGRPGSEHPLYEGAPPAGHSHSVARNEDPHRETKLSSGRGLTQERFDETLATGRPPRPARSLSDANDD
jgi:uncharacterized protein (DUF2267 family)